MSRWNLQDNRNIVCIDHLYFPYQEATAINEYVVPKHRCQADIHTDEPNQHNNNTWKLVILSSHAATLLRKGHYSI